MRAVRQALLVTSLLAAEVGYSCFVQAALGDWKPVLSNYSGKLTMQGSYKRDDRITNQGTSQTSTGQTFRQSVSLNTVGYVYHPNLMLFRLSGTYGENQDRTLENDVSSKGRGGFENYEMESKIFRAKPYTLDLSTKKDTPFTSAPNNLFGMTREDSKADFNYRNLGHRGRLQYHNTVVTEPETKQQTQLVDTVDDFDGNYGFSKPKLGALSNFGVTLSGGYQEDGLETSGGQSKRKTRSKQGNLSNTFGYSIFDFITSVNGATGKTSDSRDASYDMDLQGFNEGISIRLPWDFTSMIDYGSNRANTTNRWTEEFPLESNSEALKMLGESSTTEAVKMLGESSTTDEHFRFSLAQKLYESLDSRLTAKRETSDTRRSEGAQDANGVGNLESGIGEDNEYGLETRYTKKLPHSSTATATLSGRNTQRKEPGVNLEHTVFSAISEFDGVIPLNDFMDTTGLTVDVLRNGLTDGICQKAVSNATSPIDSNQCWIPLVAGSDYTIKNTGGLTPEIVPDIGIIKVNHPYDTVGNPKGFDYASFPDSTIGAGKEFTFRVNSHRKPADFTTQTSQVGTGLTLFQFISSNYQHSETSQSGTSGLETLALKIVSDVLGLGVSLYDWTFHAEREWQQSDSLNTITNFTLSYSKSKKLWQKLTVAFHAAAKKGWANDDSGINPEQNEEGYLYSLSGDMPLPYVQASLHISHDYDYTKGQISRLATTSYGTMETTRDLGISEQTSLRNSILLNKPFHIPWVDLAGSGYARYRWETQTTNTDGGKDRSYLSYGANLGRGWQFGATSVNLNANYAITEDVFDEGKSQANYGNILLWPSKREEETNKTTVMLTVTRQLF